MLTTLHLGLGFIYQQMGIPHPYQEKACIISNFVMMATQMRIVNIHNLKINTKKIMIIMSKCWLIIHNTNIKNMSYDDDDADDVDIESNDYDNGVGGGDEDGGVVVGCDVNDV